jgi:hypothetical protein
MFSYDPDTGMFRRIKARPGFAVGSKVGAVNNDGYIIIGIDGKYFKAHQLAWLYVNNEWPSDEVDHKNGNRLDNRIRNLRVVNHAGNMQNQGKRRNNKSGYKGVAWFKATSKWHAQIYANGKKHHLGFFDNVEDAAEAYALAAAKYHQCNPAAAGVC